MDLNLFKTYAKYNQWMNQSLYDTCKKLGQDAIEQEQGAFFGSILGTLNHLLIADVFWLARCSGDKSLTRMQDESGNTLKITALDQIVYGDLNPLWQARQRLDRNILTYLDSLNDGSLENLIEYRNSRGETLKNPVSIILLHWFNHQTHHRGQVTTLLSQQGVDPGLTDLIYIKDLV